MAERQGFKRLRIEKPGRQTASARALKGRQNEEAGGTNDNDCCHRDVEWTKD